MNSFWERSSRKTLRYEEQIMSKDKYPSMFSTQMEAIVLIVLLRLVYTKTEGSVKRAHWLARQTPNIILRARVGYEMIDSQRGA